MSKYDEANWTTWDGPRCSYRTSQRVRLEAVEPYEEPWSDEASA